MAKRLRLDSYKWIRAGVGEIGPRLVSPTERHIARELEADFLQEHGYFPTGFLLKGGGVGTIGSGQQVKSA